MNNVQGAAKAPKLIFYKISLIHLTIFNRRFIKFAQLLIKRSDYGKTHNL
jgi:hypothetical protein